MTLFTYDLCLLYKIDLKDFKLSGIVDMQTDDILYETIEAFAKQKDETIKSTKIMIKNRKRLISDNFLKFNETRIERFDSNEIIYFK
jgi:hypothetical protein